MLAWNPGPDLPTPRPRPPFHGESRGLKRRPCSCAPSTASNPESSEPPSPAPSCVLGMSNGASAKDHLKGNRADTSSERSQHSVCAVTRTRHWHVLRGENAISRLRLKMTFENHVFHAVCSVSVFISCTAAHTGPGCIPQIHATSVTSERHRPGLCAHTAALLTPPPHRDQPLSHRHRSQEAPPRDTLTSPYRSQNRFSAVTQPGTVASAQQRGPDVTPLLRPQPRAARGCVFPEGHLPSPWEGLPC